MDISIAERMYYDVYKQFQSKIDKCIPEENKTVVVIGGQPGAGKSSITKVLEDQFKGNIVLLNGDDYKAYYPDYNDILKQNPDKTSEIVQPYSNYVVERLKQEVIERGLNLMVEGTMRNPQVPLNTANEFIKQGYNVEAHIVVVNYYMSRVSCIQRYEKDIMFNGCGRSVKVESHDEAYNNIPNTIQKLMDSNLYADIKVYNREGKVIGDLLNDDLVQVYEKYRSTLTPEMINDINKNIEDIVWMKQQRNAFQGEITELKELQALVNKP